MTPFAIAGLQLDLSADRSNVDYIVAKSDLIMHLYPWVQMIVVSELAPFGPFIGHAAPLPSDAERLFQDLAARHRIWLLPGSVFESAEGKIYNTASVIGPDGSIVGRYRKMFPFMPYEQGVESGDAPLVFDVPDVGRFGVSICYDMWFPETTRTLTSLGAEVILHPTMTNTIDRDVELAIARASAAMFQCFMIDVNGAGDCGNGRSVVIGPYGDVLHQAGHAEEIVPIEIDIDRVRRSREVGLRGLGQPLKSFRDRRADFPVYSRAPEFEAYLRTLGPLVKPSRGTRAGLPPAQNNTDLQPAPRPAPPPRAPLSP